MPIDLEKLKKLVAAHGSQEKFAADIGMRQPTVSRLLAGKRGISIHTLERMARALGTSARKLLED